MKPNEIERCLNRLGFRLSSTDPLRYQHYDSKGNKTLLHVKMPNSVDDQITEDDIRLVAVAINVPYVKFIDFMNYPLARNIQNEYETILKSAGFIK